MDSAFIGSALIWLVVLYWIFSSNVLQRLWQSVTTGRALTVGGFGMGLVYGNVAIKILFGFVAGIGTLSIGGVLDLSAMEFAIGVAALIMVFIAIRRTDDDEEDD